LSKAEHCACADFLLDILREAFPFGGKIGLRAIPNCANIHKDTEIARRKKMKGEKLKIVSVGSLKEEKNYFEQLKIADILGKKGIDFSLTIAGEGMLRKNLLSEIKNLSLERFVFTW
jgi:glycosyltransferase involved in cell wall biosynthesis